MTVHRVVVVACLVALQLPPAAVAQDEVFVDPDSPTAKEYAIPVESARRQAVGGKTAGPGAASSERAAPLFGEGVGDGASANSAGGVPPSGPGGMSAGPGGATGGSDATRDPLERTAREAVAAATARPGAPGGGISLLLVAVGAAVLVAIGVGTGLLMRRRPSS